MNYFKFDLLDKPRRLFYDFNAVCDIEAVLDEGFYELLRHKVGFAFLRAVIWAGLKHEDQALTLESVGNLIQAKLHALDDDGDRQKLIADMTEVCFEALRSQGVLGRRRTPEPGTPVIDVLKSRPTSAVVGAQEAAATVVGEAIEAAPPPERD